MKVKYLLALFATLLSLPTVLVAGPFWDAWDRAGAARNAAAESQLQQLLMLQQFINQRQQMDAQRQQMDADVREQQRQQEMQRRQLAEGLRRNLAERSKNHCVSLFTANQAVLEVLMKARTTVGQLCSCQEREMFNTMSNDLAVKLALELRDAAGDPKRISAQTTQEYERLWAASIDGCAAQVSRN